MAKTAILYVDLLGVQKMWLRGGAPAVRDRIGEFNRFVMDQVNYLPGHLHRDGDYTVILSGDSVAVTCQDYGQAIGIGAHLFSQAFYAKDVSHPFWLRGAISGWSNQYLPVNTVPIKAKELQVGTRYDSEYDFLLVLALEKSGFKGMRLILDSSVLPSDGRDVQRSWSGFYRPLRIITRLKECTYPEGRPYADVLWMADDQVRYGHFQGIMAKRFKESTHDPEELMQAAWTRAVFDQVASLVWACRKDFAASVEVKGGDGLLPTPAPIASSAELPATDAAATAGGTDHPR